MDFEMLSPTVQFLAILGGASLLGYLCLFIMSKLLPSKLRSENLNQKKEIIAKAQKQKQILIKENNAKTEQSQTLELEELEIEIAEQKSDLQSLESELTSLDSSAQSMQKRLEKSTREHDHHNQKLEKLKAKHKALSNELEALHDQSRIKLERVAQLDAEQKTFQLTQNLISTTQLQSQKYLKELQEELQRNTSKLAHRMLSRTCSRYAPAFPWPKASNVVEFNSQNTAEKVLQNPQLLSELSELSEGVQIEIMENKDQTPLGVKLAGGYGIYKEAAKLALEEALHKGPQSWNKLAQLYEKRKTALEQEAFVLGKRAVKELGLFDLHDEILKMVGALNWRTSYRQNQYLHSVEVSKLAGIVASELGLCPQVAKRCGLLHDIGKGIDYRIGGSHAVISGDYADRYGESRLICDTVMSHHNDLVLETPMSFVLKTADTLSGARPGARVNLEEGYQIRLSAIEQTVRTFPGITKIAIMSGGREVHIEVNHNKVDENRLQSLTQEIAQKIEEDVAYPGQIKVLLTRRFESSAVA